MTARRAAVPMALYVLLLLTGCSSSSDSTAAVTTEPHATQQTVSQQTGLLERLDEALAGFEILDVHLENHTGPTQLAVRVFGDVQDVSQIESTVQDVAGEEVDEVLVATCPFTRSEMNAAAAYVESDAWHSDGSTAYLDAPLEIGGVAGQTIGRGMWQDCVIFFSVRDATNLELQVLEARTQELHDWYMIWSSSGSCEQGWYDELLPLATSWLAAGPNGLSTCG